MAEEAPTDVQLTEDGLTVQEKDDLWSSRRKMAWVSLWGIILPTIFIIVGIHDPTLIDKIADLMSWYYLALASIVGAYCGFKAWASIKGRGKVE
jgi:uncharacterized membrane protein